jgi:hypothetical protein
MKPRRKKPRPQPRKLRKKALFLKAFRACCNVTESARLVGCDRSLHYSWLKTDPKYAADFAACEPEASGVIEDAIATLALRGHWEPNQWQGRFQFEEIPVIDPATGLQAVAINPFTGKPEWVFKRGAQLGTYRQDSGLLSKLASAHIERFRPAPPAAAGQENADAPAFVVTCETRRE